MDMYFKLKEKLMCCGHPLSYSEDTGYCSYSAVCIACGKKYEVCLEVSLKTEVELTAEQYCQAAGYYDRHTKG